MILAIEIDNSRIDFGLFEDNGLLSTHFGITTDINKTSDEYAVLIDGIFNYYKVDRSRIDGAALCSVVPMLTNVIYQLIQSFFPDIKIVSVQKGIKTGFSIKVDNPTELGADLVANSAAAIEILNGENKKTSCIIVDMGMASTIFAINQNKEFIGGSILPGIGTSFNALHQNAAQLPNVTLIPPTKIIGKNSQESMRSGVILGTAAIIDEFVKKFKNEMRVNEITVFITGEFAQTVIPFCTCNHRYVSNLTLFGLYCIYNNNVSE